jgi:hypothetical protein
MTSEAGEGLLAVVPRQGGEDDRLGEDVGPELPAVGDESRGPGPLDKTHLVGAEEKRYGGDRRHQLLHLVEAAG